jgi:hypothetical protein
MYHRAQNIKPDHIRRPPDPPAPPPVRIIQDPPILGVSSDKFMFSWVVAWAAVGGVIIYVS